MRVAILGLPLFARRVAAELTTFDPGGWYRAFPFAEQPSSRVSFVRAFPRLDAIYYIGGGLARSRVIDIALASGKRVVMHWVGSDIVNARATLEANRAAPGYGERIRHLAEVEWTRRELSTLGIEAQVRALAAVSAPDQPAPMPSRLTVVVYAPLGKGDQYGVTAVVEAARSRPDMAVLVVGGAERTADAPANVEWLGWVPDLRSVYDRASVLVRTVAHDGLSVSVLEALARGRHVLYSQPFPHTTPLVEGADSLARALDELRDAHRRRSLEPNTSGMAFVAAEYAPMRVARGLIEAFAA